MNTLESVAEIDARITAPTGRPGRNKTRRQVDRKTAAQGAKSSDQQGLQKTKTAVYLSPDLLRSLGVACLVEGKSQSEIIEALIKPHLKPYGTSIRGERIKFHEITNRPDNEG